MSPKNLNASNKTHKFLLNQLKDKQTSKIYKKFEKNLDLREDFIVAVSGGQDSLALCFLSKIYSIKKHKARLSGPPETATIKSSFKSRFFSNLL